MVKVTVRGVYVEYAEGIEFPKGVTEAGEPWDSLDLLVQEEQYLFHERKIALNDMTITKEGDEYIINSNERSPIRRVRRITGYLSNFDNFNHAKKRETEKRVSHVNVPKVGQIRESRM